MSSKGRDGRRKLIYQSFYLEHLPRHELPTLVNSDLVVVHLLTFSLIGCYYLNCALLRHSETKHIMSLYLSQEWLVFILCQSMKRNNSDFETHQTKQCTLESLYLISNTFKSKFVFKLFFGSKFAVLWIALDYTGLCG